MIRDPELRSLEIELESLVPGLYSGQPLKDALTLILNEFKRLKRLAGEMD